MIGQLLDKQILPPQMPDFATTHAMTAATRTILATTPSILALTWFCHLSMCLCRRIKKISFTVENVFAIKHL